MYIYRVIFLLVVLTSYGCMRNLNSKLAASEIVEIIPGNSMTSVPVNGFAGIPEMNVGSRARVVRTNAPMGYVQNTTFEVPGVGEVDLSSLSSYIDPAVSFYKSSRRNELLQRFSKYYARYSDNGFLKFSAGRGHLLKYDLFSVNRYIGNKNKLVSSISLKLIANDDHTRFAFQPDRVLVAGTKNKLKKWDNDVDLSMDIYLDSYDSGTRKTIGPLKLELRDIELGKIYDSEYFQSRYAEGSQYRQTQWFGVAELFSTVKNSWGVHVVVHEEDTFGRRQSVKAANEANEDKK